MNEIEFDRLPLGALREHERLRLLEEIAPLRRHLGCPGDWGYGTKLATLTIILDQVRQDLSASPQRTDDGDRQ